MSEYSEELENLNLTISALTEKVDQILKVVKVINSKTEKTKKSKKVKLPGEPKRPLTGYFFFTNDRREDLKTKQPELKITEVSKVLGQEWAKLNETEKQKYADMATKDKKRYAEELEEWKATQED
tara:strand:+ start:206 stop:580 length:375 start_codon:yes stop_codon:yes gene_type:complete